MDITTDFGSVVGGSNPSGRTRGLAPIAQLVEQETLNLCVLGSSPSGGTEGAGL